MNENISIFLSLAFIGAGVVFFIAGTVGLIRFPDVYTRLHALAKADNLGLGMVILGLALQANSLSLLFKLFLIWFFIIVSGATSCYLIAQAARKMGITPWTKP